MSNSVSFKHRMHTMRVFSSYSGFLRIGKLFRRVGHILASALRVTQSETELGCQLQRHLTAFGSVFCKYEESQGDGRLIPAFVYDTAMIDR